MLKLKFQSHFNDIINRTVHQILLKLTKKNRHSPLEFRKKKKQVNNGLNYLIFYSLRVPIYLTIQMVLIDILAHSFIEQILIGPCDVTDTALWRVHNAVNKKPTSLPSHPHLLRTVLEQQQHYLLPYTVHCHSFRLPAWPCRHIVYTS